MPPKQGRAPYTRVIDPRHIDDAFRAAWDELGNRAAEPNVFARRWFVEPSLAQGNAASRCRLFAVEKDNSLIGIFPVCDQRFYGRVPMAHAANWTHPNMFLAGTLIARGAEGDAWSAFFSALQVQRYNFALFGPLDRDGPAARGLVEAAEQGGFACRIVLQESRALLDSGLPSETYWQQTVPGKKRKELRRQERRLGELGVLAFEWLDEPADLLPWCDDFLSLEGAGWKGREGSAMASDPTTERLFRNILAGAQAEGALAMCRLTLDRRPIAMLVTLIADGAGFSFKTAYDETLAAYSPGVLLQRYNIHLCRHAKLDWIDSCARPDHPMIETLWTGRRALGWYAVSLSGGLHRLGFDAIHALKGWKRGLRGMSALEGSSQGGQP